VLLGSYAVTDDYDVLLLLKAILQSGSPMVLFCLPIDIAEMIVNAAAMVEAFDTSSILWIFSDFFVTYDIASVVDSTISSSVKNLNGAFFLYPYRSTGLLMDNFMSNWMSLDPEEYIDTNDDRTDLNMFSYYLLDSVATLAMAYQITLDEGNYEDGSILRERVFFNLANNVVFEGLSGLKSFNSFGDLSHPVFNVKYVGASSEVIHVGNINDTSINVNLSSFYWPDGTQGRYCYTAHY
jgi:hypothetical protein